MLSGTGLGKACPPFSPRRTRTFVGFETCDDFEVRSPVIRPGASLAVTADIYKEIYSGEKGTTDD